MRLIDRAIDLFLIYWLFIATTALLPLLILGEARSLTPEGTAQLRLLILPSLAMVPFLTMSRYREMTSLLLKNPWIVLMLIWIWLSVIWSVTPEITLRRALSMTTYTLLAAYLIVRHDHEWIIRRLAWMVLVLLAISLVFIVFLPSYSAMPDGRGVRGIFTHKNGMGGFLVLAIAILMSAIKGRLVPRIANVAGLLVATGLLPVVNSATATVVAAALFAVYGGWWLLSYSSRIALTAGLFAVSATSFLALATVIYIDELFALIGRDPTFTGRTELWAYVWEMIKQRWLFGYGYEAFWEVEAYARYAADSLRWDAPNSHNGILDTFLGLGIIGLSLFLAILTTTYYRIATALKRSEFQPAALLLILVSSYILRSLVESNLLVQNDITWVLIISFTMALTPGFVSAKNRGSAAGDPPRQTFLPVRA